MVALILVLTALCVLATMAALAMERREDVGLMKALGGSISRIVATISGRSGRARRGGRCDWLHVGIALTRWMGERVFDASISPRWEMLPLTVALMIAVRAGGRFSVAMLGKVKPAVILRGE